MKKLSELNLLRAIACIFVVLTHSITSFLRNVEVDLTGQDQYIVWIRFALLCATPIFILISESLIAKNYPNKLPKGFFYKRIKYVLVPYILIGAIVSYRASDKSLLSFWEGFYQRVIYGDWYGFFVLVIIQFYVLHWVMGKVLAHINPVLPLLIAFGISYFHLHSYAHVVEYREFILTEYPLWHRTHIFAWLFYFVAAFYIGRYYESIMKFLHNKVWIPTIAVGLSFSHIVYTHQEIGYHRVISDRYDMLLYAVSVFFLILVLIRKLKFESKGLMVVSSFSFFIYLTHMITLPHFVDLTLSFSENFFVYIGILSLLTISVSIGWAMLFYQTGFTRLFTGKIAFLEEKKLPAPVVMIAEDQLTKPEVVAKQKKSKELSFNKKVTTSN